MYARLEIASDYLQFLGLTHDSGYRLMLERLSGNTDVQPLRVLADVLEPVKGYGREQAREYESFTPLNRLVDTVHPESETARRFSAMVERYLSRSIAPAELEIMTNSLARWRNNALPLQPVLQDNALLKEVTPLSQNLTSVAAAGLQALEYLNHGGRAPASWRKQQLALLKQAEKPQAELLNMIVPSVEKLVAATTPE